MRGILIALGIIIMVSIPVMCSTAKAESFIGLGGAVHNGHSYSSGDKIDPPEEDTPSLGWTLFYERGRDYGQLLDFTHSERYTGLRFSKRDNSSMRTSWEYASMFELEGRAYVQLLEEFAVFGGVGGGLSIATDGSAPFASVSYGAEFKFDDNWCIEVVRKNIHTTVRRHDFNYGINIKVKF